MRLGVVVEGHGEVQAAPVLIRRVMQEMLERYDITVGRPVRMSRSRLGDKFPDLERQVAFAAADADLVIVLFDADDDCPAEVGPILLARAEEAARDVPVALVLANREYEAWFLATLPSLRGKCGVASDAEVVENPEAIRGAKQRLQRAMASRSYYSETVDQPRMSAALDLALARAESPSFDKLCRDIERLVPTAERPE